MTVGVRVSGKGVSVTVGENGRQRSTSARMILCASINDRVGRRQLVIQLDQVGNLNPVSNRNRPQAPVWLDYNESCSRPAWG